MVRRAQSQSVPAASRPPSPPGDEIEEVWLCLLLVGVPSAHILILNTQAPFFDSVDELQQHVCGLEM